MRDLLSCHPKRFQQQQMHPEHIQNSQEIVFESYSCKKEKKELNKKYLKKQKKKKEKEKRNWKENKTKKTTKKKMKTNKQIVFTNCFELLQSSFLSQIIKQRKKIVE